jgi:hypothetical protein
VLRLHLRRSLCVVRRAKLPAQDKRGDSSHQMLSKLYAVRARDCIVRVIHVFIEDDGAVCAYVCVFFRTRTRACVSRFEK